MKKPLPFGKYYLLERINVGGMAEVFRAKAYGVEGFERLVAVKRILPNIAEDKEFIKMFIDEAKIAVQLNHANIAQIFDLGMVDSSYYIALEHVHGRDLRNIFDRGRQQGEPMAIAQACFVTMKVCEGLDYAHNKRDQSGRELHLVHRDVSPQNMLVSFEGEVKLIDFGIAKAAGKGSKTQAGILKGKFGYMSPEQVRGLPVDRRSDIFSCGIVLYELLTGERLFVGESDFSTLEKVRNVEILPPSTYNRKIPDELERIVLKALSKDVEDRYQNAIDLHDELQAFVYTAGEFYSRKDLAAWMKRVFAREIEEETAKLESYRQLKAPETRAETRPPERAESQRPDTRPPPPPHSSSQSIPVNAGGASSRPPSAPPRRTSAMGAVSAPSPTRPPPPPPAGSGSGRRTAAIGVVPPPRQVSPGASLSGAGAGAGAAASHGRAPSSNGLEWDDDELETQIYDSPEEEAAARERARASKAAAQATTAESLPAMSASTGGGAGGAGAMAAAPMASAPAAHASAAQTMLGMPIAPGAVANGAGANGAAASASGEPDLSSLVQTAKSWGVPGTPTSGPQSPTLMPPSNLAHGSSKSPSPYGGFGLPESPSGSFAARGSATMASESAFEPPPLLQPQQRPKTVVYVAIAAAVAVLAVGVVVAVKLSGSSSSSSPSASDTPAPAAVASGSADVPAAAGATVPAAAGAGVVDGAAAGGVAATGGVGVGSVALSPEVSHQTGFDLYVGPEAIKEKIQVILDGVAVPSGKVPPLSVRDLAPGPHTVALQGPTGYAALTQTVVVEAGRAPRVDMALVASEVMAKFESQPPGAKVTLVAGSESIGVGTTPISYRVDPERRYDVMFEKAGYVTVRRPLSLSGAAEEPVAVILERATRVAGNAGTESRGGGTEPRGAGEVRGGGDTPGGSAALLDDPPGPAGGSDKPAGGSDKPAAGGSDKPAAGGGDKPAAGGSDKPAASGEMALLKIAAKPPCEIYIDGANTGMHTPQRAMQLSPGKHRITLINNEQGIKETFTVTLKAGDNPLISKNFLKEVEPETP